MLISEIMGWHYFISWDNPNPADSSTMLHSLRRLGKLTRLQTKTSIVLAPYKKIHWREVRDAIKKNLNPKKGNAFYVNLRSCKGFQIGPRTNWTTAATPMIRPANSKRRRLLVRTVR